MRRQGDNASGMGRRDRRTGRIARDNPNAGRYAGPRRTGRAAAYVCAQEPGRGPAELTAQLHAIGAAAAGLAVTAPTVFIDSGSSVDGRGIGHALQRLETEALAGRIAVVFVEHVARFALDPVEALRFAIDLVCAGVRIVEVGGARVDAHDPETEVLS